MTTAKMPALFVGHGNPMNALDAGNLYNTGFRETSAGFAKPKWILCISAHWYSSRLQVTGAAQPPMIYDFHGFPEALSQVQYPAPGSPEAAETVRRLLAPADAAVNPSRGFDHGAWAVLKHLYPEADIPVIQLSLQRSLSAREHFELAKKLRPLREEGVLILGSGDIVHNLRAVSFAHIDQIGAGYDWAYRFRDAVNRAIETGDSEALIDFERFGEDARLSVPTPEHYLPLLYVMAQYEQGEAVRLFNDVLVGGSVSMTSVQIG
ncbi:MAG: 4,5-DOPA dioxygenase extradiol [Neisseria sp.]|nr:4,5-DOPA dioxygenase extradiol [Neisseria sp.]